MKVSMLKKNPINEKRAVRVTAELLIFEFIRAHMGEKLCLCDEHHKGFTGCSLLPFIIPSIQERKRINVISVVRIFLSVQNLAFMKGERPYK